MDYCEACHKAAPCLPFVLVDGDMETTMCRKCIRELNASGEVEVVILEGA